ncbi:TPA: copper homeostasis membrane protein CopD [Kluyvera intermedia]|nr:copper homeostasis membrane protein CopD [Kluyvera intermedia]
MLTAGYIGLRGIHFAALMLLFGCALFISRLAPRHLLLVMVTRFTGLIRLCLCMGALSAVFMFALQGGIMGDGWKDVFSPQTWRLLAGTQFGSIWLWQMFIAVMTMFVGYLQPKQQGRLVLLTGAQLILLAGVGHAAMHEGIAGILQRANHALHLLCAATWLGGLLPVLFCMRLSQARWREYAVSSMMRFSRYGHVAVAGVLVTGMINSLFIQGTLWSTQTGYGRMLLIKCALVALMVAIALANRYVLVPRLGLKNSQARHSLIWMTWTEVVLGALVLAAVSLFATWEPF